jgi:hypothetical protein
MSDKKKILIGIGVVAALCLCATGVMFLVVREAGSRVTESFKTDPTSIAQVGDKIAEYDVPPGYQESMAMSLFIYDMVYITPESENSPVSMIFMMMQFTGAGNTDAEQMREAMEQQTGQSNSQMHVVETRTEVIRGEEVSVTVSETSTQGLTLRQWLAVFRGNGGPTMLMIQGPSEAWDEEVIEEFIHSIR